MRIADEAMPASVRKYAGRQAQYALLQSRRDRFQLPERGDHVVDGIDELVGIARRRLYSKSRNPRVRRRAEDTEERVAEFQIVAGFREECTQFSSSLVFDILIRDGG